MVPHNPRADKRAGAVSAVTVVFVLLAALVILGVIMVLTGRWDPAIRGVDRPGAPTLPQGQWTGDDVRNLRFRIGLRGYRMSDVDAALAALAQQLPGVTSDVPPAGPASGSAD